MMKETKQTRRMKSFFLFLSTVGYSSMRAVMKPSTVQNWNRKTTWSTSSLLSYMEPGSGQRTVRTHDAVQTVGVIQLERSRIAQGLHASVFLSVHT